MTFPKPLVALAGIGLVSVLLLARAPAAESGGSGARLAEVRRAFTLDGKIIPPEIFRDFGDGNLADSDSIWVTVDLAAAVGSNLLL